MYLLSSKKQQKNIRGCIKMAVTEERPTARLNKYKTNDRRVQKTKKHKGYFRNRTYAEG